MPQTPLEVCRTLQLQYNGQLPTAKNVTQYSINGDCFATIGEDDVFRILFEGSHDFLNWFYNFQAFMIYPTALKGAGVEAGFWENLLAFLEVITPILPKDKLISCEGHSRGAGMADQFAALLGCMGYTNIRCVTFGRPNPGDENLAKCLARFSNQSFWNYGTWSRHDIVGDGPPHLLFPFTQTSQRITVKVPPAPGDNWGDLLGWHHLTPNYDKGLQELETCAK